MCRDSIGKGAHAYASWSSKGSGEYSVLYTLYDALKLRKIFMVLHINFSSDASSCDVQADLGEEVIPCKEGHCRRTMEKRVSRSVLSKKSSRQWSPRIHEDYCGPRHHKPRHH